MIGRAHHVGFNVSDMDASLAFYVDLLGLELRRRFSSSDVQAAINGIDVKDTISEIAFLSANGCQLELVDYTYPESANHRERLQNYDIGISHFCLEVEDCWSTYRRLKQSSVTFLNEPKRATTSDTTIVKGLDPDGYIVEFIEFP